MIERYKSGFTPPGDFPFEDLSKQNGSGVGGNQINNQTLASTNPINPHPSLNHHTVHHTVKGTLGANKLKKRVGLFGIFSSNKVSHKIIIFIIKIVLANDDNTYLR